VFIPGEPFQPSRVKHISGTPFYGRLPALHTNTRLGWKGLPGTNTLARYKNRKLRP